MASSSNDTILCILKDEGQTLVCNGTTYTSSSCSGNEGPLAPSDWSFWVYLIVYIFLVMFAGNL